MIKNKITTKRIVLAAMLAALTVAGSALRITLPLEIAGTTSFHLGNIMCALSGILLGPWLDAFEAEIKSAGIETEEVSPKLLPNYTKQKNI